MDSVVLIAHAAPITGPGVIFTYNEVISPYIYVFYISFIIAFIFTPVMKTIATYYGIVDKPDRFRKMHSVPVAYLGGIAVFLAWMCGLATSQFVQVHYGSLFAGHPCLQAGHIHIPLSIVSGAVIIVALGMWDDLRKIRPGWKIAGQILAAGFLLCEGIGTHCTGALFTTLNVRLVNGLGWHPVPDAVIVATSSAMVVFVVVGACNATNLMDGLDGLCGGVTAIIATGFLFLAVTIASNFLPSAAALNYDGLRVIMALALLGGILGFVPYNFNPASIFMGDAGSMFLGYCCAVMMILVGEYTDPKWFLASTVMFALPVLDTALAFARRWVNRRPLFSADRHHFHHQLVARGYTVKQAVLINYGMAIFFVISGAVVVFMRTRYAVAFYMVIFGSLVVAAYKMGMVHEQTRVVTRSPLDQSAASIDPAVMEPGRILEIRDETREAFVPQQSHAPSGTFESGR